MEYNKRFVDESGFDAVEGSVSETVDILKNYPLMSNLRMYYKGIKGFVIYIETGLLNPVE